MGILEENILNHREKEENFINEVVSDDKYILWLINFLKANNWEFDINLNNSISLEEKNKFNKLVYFKEGISRYAKNHSIYPSLLNCGQGYFIKYKDNIYELHWISGLDREFCWFVKAIDTINIRNVIDFQDVLDYRRQNAEIIKNRLALLSKFIDDSLEMGIPSQKISDTVDKTLTKRLIKRNCK